MRSLVLLFLGMVACLRAATAWAGPIAYEKSLFGFDALKWDETRGYVNKTGVAPSGLLLAHDGYFYGVANRGGPNGTGTIFRTDRDGRFRVIHAFAPWNSDGSNADGAAPRAELIEGPDGVLYGSTTLGGPYGGGTIFRIGPAGRLRTLHAFGSVDILLRNESGAHPVSRLVRMTDGALIGTTYDGGPHGTGTVFRLDPRTGLTILHAFHAPGGGYNPDGSFPIGGVTLATDGMLYGVTLSGGTSGKGTLYRIGPQGERFHVMGEPSREEFGFAPAPLLLADDGNLYGAAQYHIFRVDPVEGAIRSVARICAPICAYSSLIKAPLLQGHDRALYGVTIEGAAFRVTLDGKFSALFKFGVDPDGPRSPHAGLVQDEKGVLYGTTEIRDWRDTDLAGAIYRLAVRYEKPITVTAQPNYVYFGDNYVLEWTSTGMTSCLDNGANPRPTSGSIVGLSGPLGAVYPMYFACRGPQGTATAYAIVSILTPPPIVRIGFAPEGPVSVGETVALYWSRTWVEECETLGEWAGRKALGSGVATLHFSKPGTYDYGLLCVGYSGKTTQWARITVVP